MKKEKKTIIILKDEFVVLTMITLKILILIKLFESDEPFEQVVCFHLFSEAA